MLKIYLSFKEGSPLELELYNYVRTKINYSAYIKELILKDMKEQKKLEEANK